MRYCNNCAHEIPEGASFCAFCGENYKIQIDYEECKHTSHWITSYKVILWMLFTLFCVAGILFAIICFSSISTVGISMLFIGIITLVGFVIAGYFSICLMMIFLEMAEDVRTMSINIEALKRCKS